MNTNIQARYARTRLEKKKKKTREKRSGMKNPKQITHLCPALQNGQNICKLKKKREKKKGTNRLFPTASMHCNGEKKKKKN